MKGNLYIRFPEGKFKALTFSYDDGTAYDIKLCEVFKKHNLKATFNLNGGLFPKTPGATLRSRITEEQAKQLYNSKFFEVACHGFTHPTLDKCDPALALNQMVSDRLKLENMFGCEIHGMAYPNGGYNDDVVEILKTAGIYYSRTVKSHCKFSLPENWLTWHPTCHHKNPKLNELADEFLSANNPRRDPLLFNVWGHSYEFGDDNNWDVIEKFAEKMSNRDDIWYATNIEIYLYCRSFSRLQYSADGTIVYNPTSTELWFKDIKGDTYNIKPGETINFNQL